MRRLAMMFVLATLGVGAIGCGKSSPPPAAVPVPVDVEWPDAGPLPAPDAPDHAPDQPPAADAAPTADPASRSTGSSG